MKGKTNIFCDMFLLMEELSTYTIFSIKIMKELIYNDKYMDVLEHKFISLMESKIQRKWIQQQVTVFESNTKKVLHIKEHTQ